MALSRLLAPLLFFSFAFFPSLCPAQDNNLPADQLVAKVLQARGGIARLKAVQSERVSGTISLGPGAEGPFTVELKRPGKMHMEVTIQGQTVLRVYDGHASGWIVNPFSQTKSAVPMSGDDLRNIADESDFDGPLVDYQPKGNQVAAIGSENIDGKPSLKLKLTTKAGEVRTYFFDAATFLLLKWTGVRKTNDQETPVESLFSDYRDVNGIKFAFEIDTTSPGTNQTQKLSISKIELDPDLDDSRFDEPSDAAPPSNSP